METILEKLNEHHKAARKEIFGAIQENNKLVKQLGKIYFQETGKDIKQFKNGKFIGEYGDILDKEENFSTAFVFNIGGIGAIDAKYVIQAMSNTKFSKYFNILKNLKRLQKELKLIKKTYGIIKYDFPELNPEDIKRKKEQIEKYKNIYKSDNTSIKEEILEIYNKCFNY